MLGTFFAPGGYRQTWFPFRLAFDLDGLRGRTMSASHMPGYGHPRFEPMIDALTAACVRHVQVGVAVFEYATRRCCGQPEHRV